MTSVFTIALTGGIGSGKSIVASIFENHGVPIIDTDIISKNIVLPGKSCFKKIVNEFGKKILSKEGTINRAMLREIIFDDDKARIKLEGIIHPEIFKNIKMEISCLDYPYCLIIIPLLVEINSVMQFDRILLVDTLESLQFDRVIKRDNMTPELLRKIMKTQATREERLRYANDVIINNAEIINLNDHVTNLHKKYLTLGNNNYK